MVSPETKISITIIGLFLLIIAVVAILIFRAFPAISPYAVAGIVGVLVGGLFTLLGSMVSSIVELWGVTRETEDRLKDRISNHALELTRMDYELRQKSLESSGTKKQFLAPAKVYRIFYKALLDLHTTGKWPEEVGKEGLLNIFELAGKNSQEKKEVS